MNIENNRKELSILDNIIKIYELEHIRDRILKLDSVVLGNKVTLIITLIKFTSNCPYCKSSTFKVKDYVNKIITHSISLTKSVYINYRNRRYVCSFCNKSFFEKNPFISYNKNISILTTMNILHYLKDPNHTFSSAARYFNVSVNSVINIFDKHVDPYRKKLPRVLCIDEVHIKSNIKYPYACVLLDFETDEIIDVLKTRRIKYLREYFERFTIEELDYVEFVVMDLWAPYKDIVKKFMPKARIVADAFHVVSHINKILDKKRINVMNRYLRLNVDTLTYQNDYGYLLKKFSWLIRKNKIPGKYLRIYKYNFSVYAPNLLRHLLNSDNELEEIYNLRNIYHDFNKNSSIENAKEFLSDLIKVFRNHKIVEIRDYGKMLDRWKIEIFNSFHKHNGIRYSNAKLESKNRQIKTIIRNAFGYVNFNRFRARVIYSLNKDTSIKIK